MATEHACAQLLDDAGAAARGEDFFRSRQFMAAEGVSHTLTIESSQEQVAIPVLVRGTPTGDHRDAISPYGYPGASLGPASETPGIEPGGVDWSATGLVSAFIRDSVGRPPCLGGATERSLVQVSDPELPRKSRMSDRQQIRRNEAAGYTIEVQPGPEAPAADVAALGEVYRATMRRADAAERYIYGDEWFATVLGSAKSWLFVARAPGAQLAAAALAVESDGIIHDYLSGTADDHHSASPSKNLIVAVTEFAEGRGALMNLGGGVVPGDNLEAFKKGFANRELPFHTHELVLDPALYATLSADRAERGFFPLYRSSLL